MVALIMGVTTLINVALIPLIASVFGGWLTGGLDLGGVWDKVTGIFGNLF